MNRVVVDANVFFDYFARRHPFYETARLVLFGCAMGDYEVWLSSSQVTDLHYLLTHGPDRRGRDEALRTLSRLRRFVRIGALGEADVDDAIAASWEDFEDAYVYFVARHLKATCIVTRNVADFSHSSIPVLEPSDFLMRLEREEGISYDEVAIA